MATQTALGRDDAALLTPVHAAVETSLTAGGAGDNTEITTGQIDLRDQFGTRRFGTLSLVLTARAVLAAAATLTLKSVRFEHSDDATTWSEVKPGATVLTLTGPAGGGTLTGATVIGCNLLEAKRYVRAKFTPDLSAAGTDTARVSAAYLLTSPTEI